MAVITVTTVDRTGKDITTLLTAAAGGGDKFNNEGQTFYVVKNGDASPHTVTFAIQTTVDGIAVSNTARNVAAGDTAIFGPFPTGIYNDANSQVNVSYSAVTSVTVAAFKCPPAG